MNTPYLEKHALFPALITSPPSDRLELVVVIPCYNEPDPFASLQSLLNCTLPGCLTEVITVINDSESDSNELKQQHAKLLLKMGEWCEKHSTDNIKFHCIHKCQLPKKHAGVGLARKIGMDEAVHRLEIAGHPEGIIACFDADTFCATNYLSALHQHFKNHPVCPACSIHYEHPLAGIEFSEDIYRAITKYELHLRYYLFAQRYAGFPFAYETIGSAMAVRSSAYQRQGGMNRRKAGEDFYFLHKFTAHPHFAELNNTYIIPSPRLSDRVPFGTGKAMQQITASGGELLTYAPQSFVDLKMLFEKVEECYDKPMPEDLPTSISAFLNTVKADEKIALIRRHTASRQAFVHRLFNWFDAFMIMKYVHFSRDNYYPNVPVLEAAGWLAKIYFQIPDAETLSEPNLLKAYRRMGR